MTTVQLLHRLAKIAEVVPSQRLGQFLYNVLPTNNLFYIPDEHAEALILELELSYGIIPGDDQGHTDAK